MTLFYRFRSINQIITKYQELERQTIFFAAPEQLNDPIEGSKDIVWAGTSTNWLSLFEHYVQSLVWAYIETLATGGKRRLELTNIPVCWSYKIPPVYRAIPLINKIVNEIKNNCQMDRLTNQIASYAQQVRHSDLLIYLSVVHSNSLAVIIEAYETNKELLNIKDCEKRHSISKMLGVNQSLLNISDPLAAETIKTILIENGLFEPLKQTGADTIWSKILSATPNSNLNRNLRYKYENSLKTYSANEDNQQRLVLDWLVLDFLEMYIDWLEKQLQGKWYTACFMRNWANSSMWGNYADNHKGVCLAFQADNNDRWPSIALKQFSGMTRRSNSIGTEHRDFHPTIFHKVNYATRPAEMNFFQEIEMQETAHSDSLEIQHWRRNYWENF